MRYGLLSLISTANLRRSAITLPAVTLLIAASVACLAQMPFGGGDPEHSAQGVIVSIRGDVLQIRPGASPKLERVLIDSGTVFTTMQMTGLDKIKPGTRVGGMGEMDDKGRVKVQMLMAGDEGGQPFGSGGRGIQSMGIGRQAQVNGTVKSVKPLVLVDGEGNPLPITFGEFTPVMASLTVHRDRLLVGTMISAEGERTVDRLLRAASVRIIGGFAPGGPGGPGAGIPGMNGGATFGTVISVKKAQLKIQARFAEEPSTVLLTAGTLVQRQVTLDPDGIKAGDRITCQGRRSGGTYEAPTSMVAAVVMPGKQRYPRVGGGGMMPMMRGGSGPGMTLTGRVVSLLPFVVRRDDGREVTIVLPGQTPYVDLRPAMAADLKPGAKIVAITEGGGGGATATRILIGASPIAGFGG